MRVLCGFVLFFYFFFFQAEDGIRDLTVTGVQTCALPIWRGRRLLEDVRLGERARLARGLGERRLNRGGRRAVGASGGDERQRQGNQGTVHERPTRRRRNSRNDAPLHRRTTSPGTSWQTPYRCRWP